MQARVYIDDNGVAKVEFFEGSYGAIYTLKKLSQAEWCGALPALLEEVEGDLTRWRDSLAARDRITERRF